MRRIKKDLARVATMVCRNNAELSISFVGSARMKALNARYRNIPKETDVLSFPMAGGPVHGSRVRPSPRADRPVPVLLGDIVISVPRTMLQAKEYGVTFHEELRRLLIHGLLHLTGYDHEKGRYQKIRMIKKEKELLNALAEMD